MGITVNTSPQQITASVGETKIDVTVSGGIGPSGLDGGGYTLPTASNSVLGGVKIGSGISIDGSGVISASSAYTLPTATASVLGGVKIGTGVTITDGVISVSTDYAAASHASTHAPGGADELFDQSLNTDDSPTFYQLSLGDQTADIVQFGWQGGEFQISGFGRYIGIETGYIGGDWGFSNGASWNFAGCTVTGLSYNSLDDLPTLFDGAYTSLTSVPSTFAPSSHKTSHATGGSDALTASDIGAAAASHAHGNITNAGAIGSTSGLVVTTGASGVLGALAQGTAGQVLKVNGGATGVEWGAAAADVSIDTTAADVLSAMSGAISADDPGADRLVFWDDSAGKLTHLEVGTGLSISGTTITASVSASDISAGTLAYARMANPTVTSPSQITSNQNDYASFARGINRFTTNAARDITGMVAGSDGEVRVLCNTGTTAANTLTIKDESSSSTAANRFSVPWNGDCIIPAEGSVVVFYDGTSSRWRVV